MIVESFPEIRMQNKYDLLEDDNATGIPDTSDNANGIPDVSKFRKRRPTNGELSALLASL